MTFPFQSSGEKFDIIFGDLTDTPVLVREEDQEEGEDAELDVWRFLRRVLESALELLDQEHGRDGRISSGPDTTSDS